MDYAIEDNVKVINNCSFANNYEIRHITLPDSVVIIGAQAFWCSTLKRIQPIYNRVVDKC